MSQPNHFEVQRASDGFRLYRNGQPFFVKGAGGFQHLDTLAACGGNSLRTWHVEQTEAVIDQARELGLFLAAGLWLQHERHGFDYGNVEAVREQRDRLLAHVRQRKDDPAIMLWGVGNEVELGYSDPRAWDAVEDLAAQIKRIDPHHPVMAVTAHVEQEVINELVRRCPSIDILGINAYGTLDQVSPRLQASAWTGPYLVTEWGPDGAWESPRTDWGAEIEYSSGCKADRRKARYPLILADRKRCLGSFAFLWGQKQETTPTWYNCFLPDGSAFECVETMANLWQERDLPRLSPRLKDLLLNRCEPNASLSVTPGSSLEAKFSLERGSPEELAVVWQVLPESADKRSGGDEEALPAPVPTAFQNDGPLATRFQAPTQAGAYRLFLYLKHANGKAATANFPFYVQA